MFVRYRGIEKFKVSLGKNTKYLQFFSKEIGAYCMHDKGFGCSAPSYLSMKNKLEFVFMHTAISDGMFFFNLSGVDIIAASCKASDFNYASGHNLITEWELSVILSDEKYWNKTIFHNGITVFNFHNNQFSASWK